MIYRTLILLEGSSAPDICDTIFFQEQYWLVGTWLDLPDKSGKKPERIVCLSTLSHKKSSGKNGYDFLLLGDPIPKSAFDLHIPPQEVTGYVVHDLPEVLFPVGLA